MAAEVQTRQGTCPTHGSVQGTRQIPRITFPWLITAVVRAVAMRRPYLCPQCGEHVS